ASLIGPMGTKAEAHWTPNPSTASQQILFANRSIQFESSQPLNSVIGFCASAHVNRIHVTGGKPPPAEVRPRTQIRGNLHLVDQAGLRVPSQEHPLLRFPQPLAQDTVRVGWVGASQKFVEV